MQNIETQRKSSPLLILHIPYYDCIQNTEKQAKRQDICYLSFLRNNLSICGQNQCFTAVSQKICNKIYMDKGKRKTPLHAVVSFTCARLVYKPSSVLNGHLSRRYVAVSLKRLVERAGNPYCSVSCIGWGLHRASSPICG